MEITGNGVEILPFWIISAESFSQDLENHTWLPEDSNQLQLQPEMVNSYEPSNERWGIEVIHLCFWLVSLQARGVFWIFHTMKTADIEFYIPESFQWENISEPKTKRNQASL